MAPLQALPLLIYAVALAFGSFAFVRLPHIAAAPIILVALGCSLFAWNRGIGGDSLRLAIAGVVGFATGLFLASFALTHLERRDATVSRVFGRSSAAHVVMIGRLDAGRSRFDARVLIVSLESERTAAADAQIRVVSIGPVDSSLFAGCLLLVDGLLRERPGRANSADFDYGSYLRRQGASGTMRATISRAACPRLSLRSSPLAGASRWTENAIRDGVSSSSARSMLSALVLGDRSALDEETRNAFSRTGLAHVLAVSGLHVLIVGMSINRILRLSFSLLGLSFFRAYRLGAVATLAVLAVYVGITGAAASSVRAAAMTAGLLWQGAVQRPPVSLNSLGAAATLLIVRNPLEIFSAGFQLSFSAVAGLVFLAPLLVESLPGVVRNNRIAEFAGRSIAASLAATAGTLPFLVVHFGMVPLAGLVLNIAAIPLTMIALASGVGIAAVPLDSIRSVLAPVAVKSTGALIALAERGDQVLGWMKVEFVPETFFHAAAIVLGAAAIVTWVSERARFCFAMLAMSAVVFGNAVRLAHWSRSELRVTVFAVGHGDAIGIETPNGKWLLVDTGDSSGGYEPVVRSVLPALRVAGARSIEAIVLTHPDRDHTGGAKSVLRSIPVGRVVLPAGALTSTEMAGVVTVADSVKSPVRTVAAGDTLDVDPSVRFLVLSPPRVNAWGDNDRSVVLKVVFGETAVLLTGDIERVAEAALAKRWGHFLLSCAVKVPHHGSTTSSTMPLLRLAVGDNETAALVSAGGRYGLPAAVVERRWEREGAKVYVTADAGAVTLRSNGKRCRVEGLRR